MGKLFVVGTPIGNLGDFSPRAIATLQSVDFIAAEDTRVTLRLLNHFDIHKPLVSYHEHNRQQRGPQLVARIQAGETAALVSDAGMPAISDPGVDLIRMCRESGVPVEVVPGPTAFASAIAVSGMPTGRFTFEGFLSVNKRSRREHLEELKQERRTMIFYEAPHKLTATLRDLLAALGDRSVAIVRELTKIHEEVSLTTLSEAAAYYANVRPMGEFVLIIRGREEIPEKTEMPIDEAVKMAQEQMENGMSAAMAARETAARAGLSKNEIYRALMDQKQKEDE